MASLGETIKNREMVQEMEESYLSYAMSVIVGRALPDIRDGLKPVHRRILYSMNEQGLRPTAKYRKSATVVGNVLGKYHPHGDTAAYESMVRMAQDFSMRYPLIDGQGNFGCFTKDTKVKLTDGRDLTFGELVEESEKGKKNYTYTVNKLSLISIAEIQSPRVTRKNAELVDVMLDNGQNIRCTPDHRFMLKDGNYKEAKDLSKADSLMPLYQRLSEKTDRLNREGYALIYQPKTDVWVPAHHLADNYNLTAGVYRKSAGRVRHHVDFNKLNNNPDNVRRLQWGEHWSIHQEHASELHKDPIYRQKIAEGRNKYWSDTSARDSYSKRLSLKNTENWQNPTYREKMSQTLSDVNKKYIAEHPEKRAEFSVRLTKTLKRQWQDPTYRAVMHDRIIKRNKNHTTNRTGKLKFLNICKVALQKYSSLNQTNYEVARKELYPYGAATMWETGLNKYFQNDANLIRQEINKNHRIVEVKHLSTKEDVYDLTIEGSHNFALAAGVFVHNSIDGDAAAAYRYTEAKLTPIAMEMLADIDKETVDMVDNFDGTTTEPSVLPTKIPNLLLNGSMGIAVGMATNIPPHNLTEIMDGLAHLIDNPDADVKDLMQFVKGPDFPTGGIIYNDDDITTVYATGRGGVVMRAKAEITESAKRGFQIIITELPYQVNKAELIQKIAELHKDKKVDGIRDLRDESDKEGLRVVVDLKADAFPKKVLNQLFKHTELQRTFHVNAIALTEGGLQPQVLGLKALLEKFIEHRRTVITRRTQYDLRKALDRAHILEGLKKALDHIDEIIKLIKASASREDAFTNLMKKFKFSDKQTNAILDMRLQTLAGLERKKIEDELKEKKILIAELEDILAHPKKILGIIKKESLELKEKYGDERRTRIVKGALKEIGEEDLIPEEESLFMLTQGGYIKRLPPDSLKAQKRGGKGLIGMETKEEDVISQFFIANTHDNILFFTNSGKVFQTKGYEVPEASRQSKGRALANFLQISQQEKITAVVPVSKNNASVKYLIMTTASGVIKKVEINAFDNIRSNGMIAIKLKGPDELRWVKTTSGADEIVLVTTDGSAMRFKETDVRPMGRGAGGVIGMRLEKGAEVVGTEVVPHKSDEKAFKLLAVMANGYGKRTPLNMYKVQHRGGKGIMTAKITPKTGNLVSAHITSDEDEAVIAISTKGQVIKTELKSISILGRATQGVRIMRMDAGDKVASVVLV